MNKIICIIKREYTIRVRKRTFWILTFLVPIGYALLIGLTYTVQMNADSGLQQVYVMDKSHLFKEYLNDTKEIKFITINPDEEENIKKITKNEESVYILKIPAIDINDPKGVELLTNKKGGMRALYLIRQTLNETIREIRVKNMGFDKDIIKKLSPNIDINIQHITKTGLEKDNSKVAQTVGVISGFLCYMFIFLYGTMVLRGVQEEKQSRIVEIIISSVKPFDLMMGKIIGIAMVGLTQFLLWVVLITLLPVIGFSFSMTDIGNSGMPFANIFSFLRTVNLPLIIGMFICYFVGGYLLYSSLFASLGAAVDNQSDMQQFMLPITIPLIFSIIFLNEVIEAPNSAMAVWLSLIPFTSPIIMMARICFDIPVIQIIVSLILLILGFIGTTWLSAKIYRVGILTYGTKVTYRDLKKWLFYK